MEHTFTGHEEYIIGCWEREHAGASDDERLDFLAFAYYLKPILHAWYQSLEQTGGADNKPESMSIEEVFAKLTPERRELFIEFIIPKYKHVFFNLPTRRDRGEHTTSFIGARPLRHFAKTIQRLLALL